MMKTSLDLGAKDMGRDDGMSNVTAQPERAQHPDFSLAPVLADEASRWLC